MRWLVALTVMAACADLPDLDRSLCGNAIVEEPEDCDSFDDKNGARCLPPGEDGACHFDCSPLNSGAPGLCPDGWACDFDNLCRRANGLFEAPVRYTVGGVDSLVAGDFDGDGRVDLVSRDPRDLAGRATLSFHYFDARAALVETHPFRKLVLKPAIGNLSSDALSDLVFSDFRVGVLLGRADRSWVPEAFTPYVIPEGFIRLTGMRQGSVNNVSPLATVAATLSEGPGLYAPDRLTNTLTLRARFDVPLPSLLGDPLGTNVIDSASSPCDELVLAFRGEQALRMFELCTPDVDSPDLATWLDQARLLTVPLQPPAALDGAPLSADLNGDGHLDVLVGAGGITYAAYGDGNVLSAATPYRPTGEQGELIPNFTMPLAVGDLSGDGAPDFVLADRVFMSLVPEGTTLPRYNLVQMNAGGRWTTAKIADLNGNGFLDAVAAERGRLHVDFFNGSGKPWLLESKLLSTRPVSELAVGDFDGDLIGDLVIVEQAASVEERDTVKVAFGALSEMPSAPRPVARVKSVQQVGAYREAGTTSLFAVGKYPVENDPRTMVYLLGGNAERIPFAALDLISFSMDGNIGNVVATGLTLGAFAGPAPKDLIVLAVDLEPGTWGFWFIPGLDGASPIPLRLGGALDARSLPSDTLGTMIKFPAAKVYATGTAADVNRDGRDETIWAMPAEGTRCGVETFTVNGQAPNYTLLSGGLVILDAPCADPQLSAVDADQDGFLDLALLTGSEQGSERKLFVLWNDGSGHFAADRTTLVNSNGDSPQAFTTMPASALAPFRFVYASQQAVVQWRYAGARTFAAPSTLASLRRGSGIVAADLDGDRAIDLAVADDGDILVLNAQLR